MDHVMVQVDIRRLKAARDDAGLTQERLAEEVGFSVRKLQEIEACGRVKKSTLIAIANVCGTVLEALLAKGQEPWFIPRQHWDRLVMPPGALLRPDLGIVPFHFRSKERDDLRTWCSAGAWFGLRLYTGPGGIGKTRRALKLCEELAEEGWRAGLLDYDAFQANEDQWHEILAEELPLLIILDYTENHHDEFAWLLRRSLAEKPNKIRFLVLARTGGDWWEQLKAEKDAGDLLRGAATSVVPLTPLSMSMGQRKDSFRVAVESFAEALKKPAPAEIPADIAEPHYERALLLHMKALALVEGVQVKGEDGILDYVLGRERRFWTGLLAARDLPSRLGEALGQAMAIVTLNRGILKAEQGIEVLQMVPLLKGQSSDVLHAINNLLSDCYPGAKWIEPVLPDLLGERLFEVYLEDRNLRSAVVQRLKTEMKAK